MKSARWQLTPAGVAAAEAVKKRLPAVLTKRKYTKRKERPDSPYAWEDSLWAEIRHSQLADVRNQLWLGLRDPVAISEAVILPVKVVERRIAEIQKTQEA